MKCPACQSESPSDSRYCHRCGSAIEEDASETLPYTPAQKTAAREAFKFNPGEKFGDRYTIIEEIGRGGMGRVYKAEDHELGITVVLKMIRPELSSRPRMVDQFRKETLLGRSISHENVVRIHDLGVVTGIRYISMDFVKGENLSELIKSSGGSLTPASCLQIAIQICQALRAAHQKGIIHQDLKPENVMIDNSGKVYVTDFGLAESLSGPKTGASAQIRGTPKYLSPEQAKGEEPDPRSDIYSLGIILYEMITGKAPFKAETADGYIREHLSAKPPSPSKANPAISPGCERIILKCLEKKKENRYQSIEELLQDLEIQRKRDHGAGPWPGSKWPRALRSAALLLLLGIVVYGSYKLLIEPGLRPPSGRTSIAVMYAVNNSGDKSLDDKFRWPISYYLGTDLAQSQYLSVVPQDRLMQALSDLKQMDEEHHLSRTLDRIADAAAVQYFILPSFTKVGDDFWISFLVRKAKSDATLGEPDVVKGKSVDDLPVMIEELSAKVKSKLNFSAADIANDAQQKTAPVTPSSLEAVRYYIDAEKAYIEGDFRSSNQVLEKAVNEDPDYALAYKMMAENYNYLGELDNNRLYIRKALSLADHVSEKDRLIIQEYAARVLNESPLQAMEFANKLIALDPKDQYSYIKLGAIWRNLEEWDLAMEQFNKTLTVNPENSIALENKVYIETAQGRYQEAIELNKASLKVSLNNAFFLENLPLLYLIRGQYDQASIELERALASAPDHLFLLELKGHLPHLKGDLASARQLYERLQRRGEATPDALNLQGRFWLAQLDLLQGKDGQARKPISEGIELARRANRVYDELAFRLFQAYSDLQRKRFSSAAETLKSALELSQKSQIIESQERALHLMGLASLGMGQIDEAKRIHRQLRHLVERTACPKHLRRCDHLSGCIALAEGRPGQAIHDLERAVSLLPSQQDSRTDEQAFYYDSLATAFYRSGDWPKAIETYDRIIALTTGRLRWGDIYAGSHYWLGEIHRRSGNRIEAAANYERFLWLRKTADSGSPEVADAQKQLETLRTSRSSQDPAWRR